MPLDQSGRLIARGDEVLISNDISATERLCTITREMIEMRGNRYRVECVETNKVLVHGWWFFSQDLILITRKDKFKLPKAQKFDPSNLVI
jgi:hypothetical protein